MDVEIRPCASVEEVRQAITPIRYYFGRSAPDETTERLTRVLPAERVYAAWEGDRAVGGLGAFPLLLTVPGGQVPATGITVAGVLPTHRRRGLLRGMMRALLDASHRRGKPVAYLWATEDTIYSRFSFGLASFTGETDMPRERSAFHAPFTASGLVRLVSPAAAEEHVAPIYERVAAVTPGHIRAQLGLVAEPHAVRSGLAARQRRRVAMRGPRERRAACGLCALPNELSLRARPPVGRGSGDRSDRRVARCPGRDLAVSESMPKHGAPHAAAA
jgi:GNAT superfamily N-acetyltransferase